VTSAFVLGLGSIGLRHATNLRKAGVACAAFDPLPDRRELARSRGIAVVARREEIFGMARPGDALVIATPSAAHAEDLRNGIDAGLNLLVEKPIAHVADGLSGLLVSARRKGLVVYPGLNLRHHPGVKAAKEILDRGGIGVPLWATIQCSSYLPDWRPHQDYRTNYAAAAIGGGVILDIIHEFDLAWFLLGSYDVVGAHVRRTGTLEVAGEDYAAVLLRHGTGTGSTLQVDYVTRPQRRVTVVAGSHATLSVDVAGRSVTVEAGSGETTRTRFESGFDDDYFEEVRHFLACVRGEAEPACSAEEAVAVLDRALLAKRMGAAA